jgi:hypothetical protein
LEIRLTWVFFEKLLEGRSWYCPRSRAQKSVGDPHLYRNVEPEEPALAARVIADMMQDVR